MRTNWLLSTSLLVFLLVVYILESLRESETKPPDLSSAPPSVKFLIDHPGQFAGPIRGSALEAHASWCPKCGHILLTGSGYLCEKQIDPVNSQSRTYR